jgi:hypothetical protein
MINEGKRGFKVRHKQKVASIEPTKPRNFVAKNAINTGAGAHKDKKKAMKQGDTKHKKDYAEGMEEKFQAELDKINEKWTAKYKSSINCSHPKGFSQKAHCAGKKKHNEDMTMEATCPDCGMCETHGNLHEIKKGSKDSNGYSSCWKGYHAAGTKKGKNGGQVRNCVPNESVAEGAPISGDGGAVANFKQQMANNTEIAYQKAQKGIKDEGIKGAIAGGAAGAVLTRSPRGAIAGADIGDKLGDMVETTDGEGGMAKQQLITAAKLAIQLAQQMDSDTQLDAWVQTKISLASDYISTVHEFLVNGEQDVDKEEETDETVVPGITHQHHHGTLKHTSTTMEGAKVDRQAKHITKSMMKAHPGMSKDNAEAAAWAHIKHPKKKKKMKEDAYDIYLEVMLGKSLKK